MSTWEKIDCHKQLIKLYILITYNPFSISKVFIAFEHLLINSKLLVQHFYQTSKAILVLDIRARKLMRIF